MPKARPSFSRGTRSGMIETVVGPFTETAPPIRPRQAANGQKVVANPQSEFPRLQIVRAPERT